MTTITYWPSEGSPLKITDNLDSDAVQRRNSSHTSIPRVFLHGGGIVPGHLETRAAIGLRAWEEMGSSSQPSPEATAVLRVGMGMGMWAEESLLSQRLSF